MKNYSDDNYYLIDFGKSRPFDRETIYLSLRDWEILEDSIIEFFPDLLPTFKKYIDVLGR